MFPEREKSPQKEDIQFTPEEIEVPEEIEKKEGVKATKTQFSTVIKTDDGEELTTSDSTKKVTITLPDDKAALEEWSKGDTQDSKTWEGIYWIRTLKKALLYGWGVLTNKSTSVKPT